MVASGLHTSSESNLTRRTSCAPASHFNFMNTECNRIADQLAATLNGEAWYGDSLHKILQGVTAAQACSRPIPCAHTIWELVAHVEVWCGLAEGAARGVAMPAWSTMSKD